MRTVVLIITNVSVALSNIRLMAYVDGVNHFLWYIEERIESKNYCKADHRRFGFKEIISRISSN